MSETLNSELSASGSPPIAPIGVRAVGEALPVNPSLFALVKMLFRRVFAGRAFTWLNAALLVAFTISTVGNQWLMAKAMKAMGMATPWAATARAMERFVGGSGNGSLSGDLAKDAAMLMNHVGVPAVYGAALGVSYDQVQASMDILKQFDPTYGQQKITLTGDLLQRYVSIGSRIACEYCCGAKTLVTKDGKAACGCAHSQAMRGLAAWLLVNQPRLSDDQILKELAIWKTKYFPKQMAKKVGEQLQSKQFTPDVAALALGLKLPDYGSGQSGVVPVPTSVEAPEMVGGC